jgi:chemotaxis protein methyltransferase CheR
MQEQNVLETLEIDLLLEAIFQHFGYDFRGYRREPLQRRLRAFAQAAGLETMSALQARVLHNPIAGNQLLRALSARNTALFNDPEHFRALRDVLGSWLHSCPTPKIWIAECTTAEDVFALAILLHEEGLYAKAQIFATSANEILLDEASRGTFDLERLEIYAQNYRASGGKRSLTDYFDTIDGKGVFSSQLRPNITWAQYNLSTDSSFNEFELILCRDALDEFGPALRRRSLQLFHDSSVRFGILSIDGIDTQDTAAITAGYTALSNKGLYRRVV